MSENHIILRNCICPLKSIKTSVFENLPLLVKNFPQIPRDVTNVQKPHYYCIKIINLSCHDVNYCIINIECMQYKFTNYIQPVQINDDFLSYISWYT